MGALGKFGSLTLLSLRQLGLLVGGANFQRKSGARTPNPFQLGQKGKSDTIFRRVWMMDGQHDFVAVFASATERGEDKRWAVIWG